MGSSKDSGTTRAVIHVTLKPGVLDPQGQAVCHALRNLGYSEVEEVRVGKRLEVRLAPDNGGGPQERLQAMCRDLLSNPVIEDFRIELIDE